MVWGRILAVASPSPPSPPTPPPPDPTKVTVASNHAAAPLVWHTINKRQLLLRREPQRWDNVGLYLCRWSSPRHVIRRVSVNLVLAAHTAK
jgi:hypothetical protein